MKKTTIVICAGLALMLTARCAKKVATANKETTTEEVATLKKNYTPSQMAEGKTIFENNCNKCHGLKMPAEFTVREWNKILPDMSRKSNLTDAQAGLVRAWVITNAKAH